MQAITVRDRDADIGGLSLTEVPYPHAAENDVIVQVHAAGFTPGEPDWPATWADRADRDRTPSVPGHELSGVVVELGYGTTGLTVGQRVFGLADWTRNGSLAEYSAVEARDLAPLPADIDHTVAAALPVSGLTAWQGLFDYAGLMTGQTVLIHGAAGGVGSIAVQLAHDVGARIIGTGRAPDRDTALGLGVDAFLDLQADHLEDAGRGRRGVRRHRRRHPRPLDRARARRRHARHHRRPAESPARGRAGHLLRRRTRPRPACGPRPATPARAAQANRRGHTDTAGSARRVHPRPAHPRQDDHPGHRRLKGEQSCAECGLPAAFWLPA
jgi:Alcohol dehydrogenase GroES-like domain